MKRHAGGVLVFVGLILSSPVFALSITTSIVGGVNDRFHRFSQDGAAFGQVADSVSVRATTAEANLIVTPGALYAHASASGNQTLGSFTGTAGAVARGAYSEQLTIDAPGLTGSSGRLTANVWLLRHLSGSGTNGGIGGSTLEFFAQLGDHEERVQYSSPGHDPSEDYRFEETNGAGNLVSLSTNFVFGRPLELELSVYANSSGTDDLSREESGIQYAATADFFLLWAGIETLTDSSGRSIPDFTIQSETGTDYRRNFAPIPEPATYSVFGVLALAIASLHRRKRATRKS